MKRFLVVILSCLSLTSLAGAGALAQSTSTTAQNPPSHVPGDYYVLGLVWQPTFCVQPENTGLKECQPGAISTQLMLGGLWPYWDMNGDKIRDDNDRHCIADAAQRADIIAKDEAAKNEWSSLPETPISAATHEALLSVMPRVLSFIDRHEWVKYGNCSGLAADDYFTLAVKMTRDVLDNAFGAAILENAGKLVERKVLARAFRQRYGKARLTALTLNCTKGADGQESLSEIRIRVVRDRADRGIVGSSLDAPEQGKKGSCGKSFLIPSA